jgi:multidrug efflux pump subunit AcrB
MIRWFAGHPTAANLLLIMIVAAGLFAAPTLKRETFPDFLPKEVGVDVEYRGATAADVEDAVCRRLIEALEGLEDLEELTCTAQDNLASAVAKMTERGQFQRFLDDIHSGVAAIRDLPPRAEAPVVQELHRTDLVAAVSVTGPMSPSHLKSYTERLQDRLLSLPGVAQVDIKGFSERELQVEISRHVLRQHGLSVSELARLITQQNVDLPIGTIDTSQQDVLVRFTDERRTAAALADLVVLAGERGGELRLGDIAEISVGFAQPEDKILFNGQRAGLLEVRKSRGDDALDVMAELEAFLAGEREARPQVSFEITQDMTTIVRDRLEMLVRNGAIGLVLVGLVMAMFFRPRLALWAAMGLPVAFLGALAAMVVLGLSINMMTLVALLMAIGIVMDDAIVITDSVATRARVEESGLAAVVVGTRRVLPGVVSSFVTTVVVFAPLSFLAGQLGAVLEVLPIVLIAALAVSLVEAFLILPHHLKHPVERLRHAPDSRWRRAIDGSFAWVREHVAGASADFAVRWRYGLVGVLLVILLGSAGYMAGGHIAREAIPDIDGDVLEARILLPQGTPLARTEQVVGEVVAAAGEVDRLLTPYQPGYAALLKSIQVRYAENASAGERGPHVATVILDLLSADRRSTTLDEITENWRNAIGEIAGIVALIIQEPGLGPQGMPIEVRLMGDDLQVLSAAAQEVVEWVAGYAGAYNVMHDLRPGKPELRIILADGAQATGLTAQDVAEQLRAGFLGTVAGTVQFDGESYDILARQPIQDRNNLDDLDDFTVTLTDGQQVPLDTVATIQSGRGFAKITRIAGERTVTVQANVDSRKGNAQAMVADMQERFLPGLLARQSDLRIEIKGQAASSDETAASIQRAFVIGLIGIFVVLAFQFRSYVEPLIVMTAIPFAFIGALWGHVLMGYNISMPSLVGAASLAGIVVNNSILLVQFIKAHIEAGLDVIAAAGQASRDRFRAILVSSTTTIAGLVPLLAETSTQAQVLKPLVISVSFGLLASTVLVLMVIPSLYVILADFGVVKPTPAATEPRQRPKEKPTPAETGELIG